VSEGRPTVIVHNAVSVDGWLDGFDPDLGLFYDIAGRFEAQAILSGSRTILAGFANISDEDPVDLLHAPEPDLRPILVVVDSRGRIGFWERIVRQPYWRSVIAVCSQSTPRSARERIEHAGVEAITCGTRRVDLARALQILNEDHGVTRVRVDSGGRLNAVLLREGLVDEVSLLIHPVIVGPAGRLPLVHPGSAPGLRATTLQTTAVDHLSGGVMWFRARVMTDSRAVRWENGGGAG
jgi:2,5-diamino-6-(ribosylamino)-4(3H)-pyrimidinone 5'-phosphate reductase